MTFEMVTGQCWVQNINQKGLFPQICHFKLRKIRKSSKQWWLFANAPWRAAFFWKLMIVEMKFEINWRFRLPLPLRVLVYYRNHCMVKWLEALISYNWKKTWHIFLTGKSDSKAFISFCFVFCYIRDYGLNN